MKCLLLLRLLMLIKTEIIIQYSLLKQLIILPNSQKTSFSSFRNNFLQEEVVQALIVFPNLQPQNLAYSLNKVI